MKLLTLGLAAGAAYLLMKGHGPARLVAISRGPSVTPSAPDSIIQYSGPLAPVAGSIAASGASPVMPSSVTPGTVPSGLGRLRGGCGCNGLGGVPDDRAAVQGQLQALKAVYGPRIGMAIAAKDRATINQLTGELNSQLVGVLSAYHAAHPDDHNVSLSRSVSPVFMAPDRARAA